MDGTQIKLVLSVFGEDFNPGNFTNYIGLHPSDSWMKGDKISGRDDIFKKESSWEFCVGFIKTVFFEDVATIFLDKFEGKTNQIRDYVDASKLEVKIFIVIEIVDEEKPALFLTKKFIQISNDLNADIDFDIYIYNND